MIHHKGQKLIPFPGLENIFDRHDCGMRQVTIMPGNHRVAMGGGALAADIAAVTDRSTAQSPLVPLAALAWRA